VAFAGLGLVLAAVGVSGCGGPAAARERPLPTPLTTSTQIAPTPTPTLPQQLPHLGPRTLAGVPPASSQVVEVLGTGRDASTAQVLFYRRTPAGWSAGAAWPAHVGLHGWSPEHHEGDLRSPIGVYPLTDAGGLLPDPGTKLSYDHSHGFSTHGAGFDGEPLAGAFDYVVAIDYNRKPGTTPLDWTMPAGAARGGQIWFHVDHGGPTHGCVSLSTADMLVLLRTLDPARHPVVVMGDAATLAR
jgi:L,D-peptidoglycan transpeptidase YkuD (ErfK/YbiS/YcfS/YnhG family)